MTYPLPIDPSARLQDFLDARYGEGGWTERTGVAAGTDVGPAIVDALTALRERYGRGRLIIPPGCWLLQTEIPTSVLSGHQIEGYGSQASKIVYARSIGAMFHFSGAGGYTGGGLKGLGLFIEANCGASTPTVCLLSGNASFQPDQMVFEDIYSSSMNVGTAWWHRGLFIDGMARPSPQGVRVGTVKNWQQFCCSNFSFGFFNAVQWTVENIGSYVGTGTGANIYIGGGGYGYSNTTQLDIRGLACNGELNLTNATYVTIYGRAASLASASTFNHYDLCLNDLSRSGTLGPNGRSVFI